MFSPTDLKAFIEECKATIKEINYCQRVIDDSQMTNHINNRRSSENLLLYGVLPDYASDTRDDDALMMRSGFDLLVLKKSTRSNLDLDGLIDDVEECLVPVQKINELMLQKMRSGCGKFSFLDEGSLQISPVWKKAGTNGYMLSLSLREG